MSENKKKLNMKEKLEIMEAICTIIVSVMAIWGGLVAYHSGFLHKVKHCVDYYHSKIIQDIDEKV